MLSELEEHIRDDEIQFFSGYEKLDTKMSRYGEKLYDLSMSLLYDADSYLTIAGHGLIDYLSQPSNVSDFTSFISRFTSGSFKSIKVHVDCDIEVFRNTVRGPIGMYDPHDDVHRVINGWVKQLSHFERIWNRDLMYAFDEAHVGAQFPKNEKDFGEYVALNAAHAIIGTREQLYRYYAFDSLTDEPIVKSEIYAVLDHFSPLQ